MIDYIETLDKMSRIYMYIGMFGTSVFVILNVLMFIGLIDELGFDMELDFESVDSSFTPFKLVTFRGVIASFMFFGWGGFFTSSILLAVLFGILAFISIGLVYYFSSNLQHSGNYSYRDIIGREGSVYLRIKGDMKSRGKVVIKINDSIKEFMAISEESLEYNEKVKVIDNLNNLLIVEKFKGEN